MELQLERNAEHGLKEENFVELRYLRETLYRGVDRARVSSLGFLLLAGATGAFLTLQDSICSPITRVKNGADSAGGC